MPRLVVVGAKVSLDFHFDGAIVAGRHISNALPLPDQEVSRHHARIFPRDGQFFVADLDSRNGVFVNGEKIREQSLQPGDEIALGMTLLFFDPPEGKDCAELLSPRGLTIWAETPLKKVFLPARVTTFSREELDEAVARWLERRAAPAVLPYKLRSDFLQLALGLDRVQSRGALAEITLDFLTTRIGAARMAVMAVDARKKNLEILLRRADEELMDADENFEINRDVVRVALDGETAVFCPSCAKDYRFQHLIPAAGDYSLGSFLAAPFYRGREYGGFLYMDTPASGPAYDYKALLQAHLALSLMSKCMYWLSIGRHGKPVEKAE